MASSQFDFQRVLGCFGEECEAQASQYGSLHLRIGPMVFPLNTVVDPSGAGVSGFQLSRVMVSE